MSFAITLESLLPEGMQLSELTPDQLTVLQQKTDELKKQIQQVGTKLQQELGRREKLSLNREIKDWTKLWTIVTGSAPEAAKKMKKKTVAKLRGRIEELKAGLITVMATRPELVMETVVFHSDAVFRQFLAMPMPVLTSMSLGGVTFESKGGVWCVTPAPSVTRFVVVNVDARVQLAALRRLEGLNECTIQSNQLTGKLSDIGNKEHLTMLRLNAFAKSADGSDTGKTLGSLDSLPNFRKLKVLELVNCGVQGVLANLNRYPTLTILDLSHNLIKGKVGPLQRFPHLKMVVLEGCKVMDTWDNFKGWMDRQPILCQVKVDGNPFFKGNYMAQYNISSDTSDAVAQRFVESLKNGDGWAASYRTFVRLTEDGAAQIKAVEVEPK